MDCGQEPVTNIKNWQRWIGLEAKLGWQRHFYRYLDLFDLNQSEASFGQVGPSATMMHSQALYHFSYALNKNTDSFQQPVLIITLINKPKVSN